MKTRCAKLLLKDFVEEFNWELSTGVNAEYHGQKHHTKTTALFSMPKNYKISEG